ncbi:MAG: ABC transporter ATP-binding protein [Planctomycetota bacterium]
MSAPLAVSNVRFSYPGTKVFDDLSLVVEQGQFVAVLGPNGCGKTTLVRLASRVVRPDAGSVRLGGDDVGGLPVREVARRLAVVPQGESGVFAFTVGEAVLMGRTPWQEGFGFEGEKDRQIAREALGAVEADHLIDRDVREISGGERQRVLLARALAQRTGFLVLDEPTSHLDLKHHVASLRLLARLREREGLTVLLISHDVNLTVRFAERVVLLGGGGVAADGTPEDVLRSGTLSDVYGTPVVVRRVEGIPVPQVYPE